jgi:hypothetical protein
MTISKWGELRFGLLRFMVEGAGLALLEYNRSTHYRTRPLSGSLMLRSAWVTRAIIQDKEMTNYERTLQ